MMKKDLSNFDIRKADSTHQNRAIDTILLAFSGDPNLRWLWPESHQYLETCREILSGDIRGSASINAGTFFDGWSGSVSFNTYWILSRHLQINGFYNYNRIRFPDRDQGFDGHLARMRFDVALNREISTAAFIQFNNASNWIFTNFRFRYNPR